MQSLILHQDEYLPIESHNKHCEKFQLYTQSRR